MLVVRAASASYFMLILWAALRSWQLLKTTRGLYITYVKYSLDPVLRWFPSVAMTAWQPRACIGAAVAQRAFISPSFSLERQPAAVTNHNRPYG